ncbi:putative membrane protein [Estrella lausannensis]|uniref:Putative membrane protein n=1 Tax=Estrella lausannensis TaxID=483423 RepID=A0A0H5DQU5_9BACT|nr:putative membrane protein [Estrella lausannensis]
MDPEVKQVLFEMLFVNPLVTFLFTTSFFGVLRTLGHQYPIKVKLTCSAWFYSLTIGISILLKSYS